MSRIIPENKTQTVRQKCQICQHCQLSVITENQNVKCDKETILFY